MSKEHWLTPRGCNPGCPACNECGGCEDKDAEIARLRDRVKEMEEALEPFAALPMLQESQGNLVVHDMDLMLTDFLRARAALKRKTMTNDETLKSAEIRVAAYNELSPEQGRALYAAYVKRGIECEQLRAALEGGICPACASEFEPGAFKTCGGQIIEEVKQLRAERDALALRVEKLEAVVQLSRGLLNNDSRIYCEGCNECRTCLLEKALQALDGAGEK